jgi:hypothetical protein
MGAWEEKFTSRVYYMYIATSKSSPFLGPRLREHRQEHVTLTFLEGGVSHIA